MKLKDPEKNWMAAIYLQIYKSGSETFSMIFLAKQLKTLFKLTHYNKYKSYLSDKEKTNS